MSKFVFVPRGVATAQPVVQALQASPASPTHGGEDAPCVAPAGPADGSSAGFGGYDASSTAAAAAAIGLPQHHAIEMQATGSARASVAWLVLRSVAYQSRTGRLVRRWRWRQRRQWRR